MKNLLKLPLAIALLLLLALSTKWDNWRNKRKAYVLISDGKVQVINRS